MVEAFAYRPERSLKRRKIANDQDQKFTSITAVNVLNPSKDVSNALQSQQDAKKITCDDCKTTFDFTKGEQEYYQSKGLTEPKRCKACRTKAAAQRQETRAATKTASDRLATAIEREKR